MGGTDDTNDQSRPYFAFFNLDDESVILHATWKQLGLPGKYPVHDLWNGSQVAPSEGIEVTLPAHRSTSM
jgi:hypothetical protein